MIHNLHSGISNIFFMASFTGRSIHIYFINGGLIKINSHQHIPCKQNINLLFMSMNPYSKIISLLRFADFLFHSFEYIGYHFTGLVRMHSCICPFQNCNIPSCIIVPQQQTLWDLYRLLQLRSDSIWLFCLKTCMWLT